MVQFLLNDPEPLIYHNQPIWRDDVIIGYITSGMFGHTLGILSIWDILVMTAQQIGPGSSVC